MSTSHSADSVNLRELLKDPDFAWATVQRLMKDRDALRSSIVGDRDLLRAAFAQAWVDAEPNWPADIAVEHFEHALRGVLAVPEVEVETRWIDRAREAVDG